MPQPLAPRQFARARSFMARNALVSAALAFTLAACASGGDTSFTHMSGSERQAALDSLKGDVPPQSTEMARGQCWMKYENTKVAHDLDEKMKLVDQCMEEKKRKYPLVVQ
ncbi:MAG TPA: hypothetical protein VKT73_06015 [Xanthobacteraceae bacterium]|nr:hypothetical protein [Xanthobacteraceae bacterium]